MTAARVMDIISRLPGCAGQAADAVWAYTQVKMEDAMTLLKIPKSECPDIWKRQPKHKWPKSWSSMKDPVVPRMGKKNAKLKEKQKWSNEKFHLENARKLRGMYFIDPEDKEFKQTIKNARKKLETPIAPAMPCKIMKKNCGSGASNKMKTRLACILEADESTRLRMGESLPNHHEDHAAGKGDNSLQH